LCPGTDHVIIETNELEQQFKDDLDELDVVLEGLELED
jgi:hypothetical protein